MSDIVIIGAGVIGCSTAYHLAKLGAGDIAVVEMGQVGSGSSSKSASMLSLQFCQDELTLRMAQYSYARYMAFEEEMGAPIDFKRTGWLTLATEGRAEWLRHHATRLQTAGVVTDLLSPDEIRQRYPEIRTDDITLGTWGPDDGPFDPHMIMWGYTRRASELGVRFRQGVRATGIMIDGGGVVGVQTTAGPIATRMVVNAAGPWAAEVGQWAGVDIPLRNSVRGILITGPTPNIPPDRPFVEDLASGWYYRPEGEGVLMGMGAEPVTSLDDPQFSPDLMDAMIEAAVHRVPALERASVLTTWAGVRPLTADGLPFLGPVSGLDGFLCNCGWGGVGIIMAPVAGQLLAEHICHGQTATLDISPFSLRR